MVAVIYSHLQKILMDFLRQGPHIEVLRPALRPSALGPCAIRYPLR